MTSKPLSGLTGSCRFKVELQHLIDFADGDMPAVLSTPWLIKWLEQTARETLRPLLAEGEATVGIPGPSRCGVRFPAPSNGGRSPCSIDRYSHPAL